MNFNRISILEAVDLVASKAPKIVDIRDPQSFSNGRLPRSFHLTNDNVAQWIESTSKQTPIIVVCYHGNSSQQAAGFLSAQGFESVYSLDGGFESWKLSQPYEQE